MQRNRSVSTMKANIKVNISTMFMTKNNFQVWLMYNTNLITLKEKLQRNDKVVKRGSLSKELSTPVG